MVPSIARPSLLLLLALACACGGGEGSGGDGDGGANGQPAAGVRFPEGTTCGAALDVSGAVELRIPPSNTSTACATGVSFDDGFSAGFLFVESELSHADLDVQEVLEGETGAGFPARLELTHDDGREWNGERCTAEILEHAYVAPAELGWKSYRVAGSVECTAMPSADGGTEDALDLRSFAFVATIHWSG